MKRLGFFGFALLAVGAMACSNPITVRFSPASGQETSFPTAKGTPTLVVVPAIAGQTIVYGDGAQLQNATRLLLLAGDWTRRGSSTPLTLAAETALLTAGKVPVLPSLLLIPGQCTAIGCVEGASDIQRMLVRGATAEAELVLQLTDVTMESSLLVPCGNKEFCPANAVTPRALREDATCIPRGAYPIVETASLSARAISPTTGEVVAVVKAVLLPTVESVAERRFTDSGKELCSWEVGPGKDRPTQAELVSELLTMVASATAKPGVTQPLDTAPAERTFTPPPTPRSGATEQPAANTESNPPKKRRSKDK